VEVSPGRERTSPLEPIRWTTRWDVWRNLMGTPSSRQRERVMALLQTRPALLYWGDSWFSTPLYLNLARQSLLRVDGLAMLVGTPGATAAQLLSAANIRRMVGWLESYPFDALLLSAGGNDQLSGRLAQIFAAWQPPLHEPVLTPDAAYERLLRSGSLQRVRARFDALLHALAPLHLQRPQFRVLAHSYCRLRRIGVAADLTVHNIDLVAWLKDDVGPWLWGPMRNVLRDVEAGRAFADLMLDGFRDEVLRPLELAHAPLFGYADFLDLPAATQDAFWHDEIHPTEAGFADVAIALNARLRNALPAAKRAAVR